MFIGRNYELGQLKRLVSKKSASLAVVYGRRRVGKSRLISEFTKSLNSYHFIGLPPDKTNTRQKQLDEFSKQLSRECSLPRKHYTDWGDVFFDLSHYTKKKQAVIVLDEVTWMGSGDDDFLGKLKNTWDLYFNKNPELILILCGSVSAWIKQNIILNTGFHGHLSLKMKLRELPLKYCKYFWGKHEEKIKAIEKIKVLSVTGGIPKYLEEIDPAVSSEENIRTMCFEESGLLFNDYDQIFSHMLQKDSVQYYEIIKLLATKNYTHTELVKKLDKQNNGTTSKYIEELCEAGFVGRYYTWNLDTDKPSTQSQYKLTDNYLRFYLKYIGPNIDKIISQDFRYKSMSSLPGWHSIMGLQIENIIINNRHEIIKKLAINPDELLRSNPYFQNPTKKRRGCQIDFLIQTKFKTLYVCEIKSSRNLIGKSIVNEVEEKTLRLERPKGFSIRPVLIHTGEVHDEVYDSDYFAKIINLGELFEE